LTVQPQEGTFTFIYDFENFSPSDDITIVGIENPSNFRHIQKQRKLFGEIQPLFVSRYPQRKDLVKWLQTIPNPYLFILSERWDENSKKYSKKIDVSPLPGGMYIIRVDTNAGAYTGKVAVINY